MQTVFEKIVEKLEERTSFLSDCTKYGNKDAEQQNKSYSTMMMYEVVDLVDDLIEIVKQEAEQYNNGWIPCSEQLPKYGEVVMCSCTNGGITISCITHSGEKQSKIVRFGQHSVIAWQPLPQPYQPKGE